MKLAPSTILILILTMTLATLGIAAQETATAAEATSDTGEIALEQPPAAEPVTDTATRSLGDRSTSVESEESELNPHELRNQFGDLILQHPYDLGTTLAYDPLLLANDQFLQRYPEIARFVAEHPEVSRNPSFYMANFTHRTQNRGMLESIIEPIMIFAVFVLIAAALSWLLRTIIEQKRWNRLSQSQSEVHNKILDRFSTSNELLEYVKTPAGSKFLEAAPIPLHAPRPVHNAPLARIMWSVQIGVIIAIGSLGMLLVSFRLADQAGDELFAFGLIAFCIGAGFIGSAAVSLIMSQRLGLWDPSDSPAQSGTGTSGDSGTVR